MALYPAPVTGICEPGSLATLLSGARSGARNMPTPENSEFQDGARAPWEAKMAEIPTAPKETNPQIDAPFEQPPALGGWVVVVGWGVGS